MEITQSLDRTLPEKTQRALSGILRISAAFNVALSKETQAIYLSEMARLSEAELLQAVTATIREWDKPSMMPPLSFVLERAVLEHVQHTRRFASVADIDPERCPNGWTPEQIFAAHLTQEKIRGGARRPMPNADGEFPTIEWLGRRSGVTKADIEEWREAGAAKQRAAYAELAQDPKWRMEQARWGVPAYKHLAEPSKLRSEIPEDPDERMRWARAKVRQNGWVEREPGDEHEA